MATDKFHTNPRLVSTAVLGGLIFGYFIGVVAADSPGNYLPPQQVVAPADDATQQPQAEAAANPSIVLPTVDDDAVLGSADAPVTLIEFSDFQCPFCRSFANTALKEIKKNYVETGKVKIVYRDYPLPFHPAAIPAARAAECAHEQDKFWEMHDQIYLEQDKQGSNTIEFGAEDLKSWAKNVTGLNHQKWETCFSSDKYTDEINKDLADGMAAGINGTPAVFINGKEVVGAQPYPVFQQAIEAALKESK